VGASRWRKRFHVKHRTHRTAGDEHRAQRPENAILQNNPMHQKFVFAFQRHRLCHFRHISDY